MPLASSKAIAVQFTQAACPIPLKSAVSHAPRLGCAGSQLFLSFRGSCSLRNAMQDVDYQPCEQSLLDEYERESGVALRHDVRLHRGFLQAGKWELACVHISAWGVVWTGASDSSHVKSSLLAG